jgi:hypothetical protein
MANLSTDKHKNPLAVVLGQGVEARGECGMKVSPVANKRLERKQRAYRKAAEKVLCHHPSPSMTTTMVGNEGTAVTGSNHIILYGSTKCYFLFIVAKRAIFTLVFGHGFCKITHYLLGLLFRLVGAAPVMRLQRATGTEAAAIT